MAETIVCPHCKGTGMNYVIVTQDGKPTLQPVGCVVCDGKGYVAAPPATEPEVVAPPPAATPELWPILVPLGIFFLFFAFLWM